MEDIYNTKQRLESVPNKIKCSNISDSNKQKLAEFTHHCLADSVGKNKVSRYLYDLYNITLWLDRDFEKAEKGDIERVLFKLQETNYSEWTKRGHKVIIRKFYKWLRNSRVYPDEVDWIKTTIKENHKKLPEEILTPEEIKKLIKMYKSHTSRTIKELCDKKLLVCKNPEDREFKFYIITPLGKEVLKEVGKL